MQCRMICLEHMSFSEPAHDSESKTCQEQCTGGGDDFCPRRLVFILGSLFWRGNFAEKWDRLPI
jgi:hypothetical protein